MIPYFLQSFDYLGALESWLADSGRTVRFDRCGPRDTITCRLEWLTEDNAQRWVISKTAESLVEAVYLALQEFKQEEAK